MIKASGAPTTDEGSHVRPRTPQSGERRERRIIERPRLTKLLDESEARIILLLAPAGYGKTTLARQWAKTLSSAIWITCTPAHRDVAVLAEDVASCMEPEDESVTRFVREFVSAHGSSQRVGRSLARTLAKRARKLGFQWLVIDDYHELLGATEAELFVESLHQGISAKLLISSRQRPSWGNSRRVVYGEITEITREHLAMTEQESAELLGAKSNSIDLVTQAEGWAAVLALAASVEAHPLPREALPSSLYRYFADELYQSARPALRDWLVERALVPSLSARAVASPDESRFIGEAQELGFLSHEDPPELHPLLREFLIYKLAQRADSDAKVREGVGRCVESEAWEAALDLLTRFRCDDLIDPVLSVAFKPLALSGRLDTLAMFASSVRRSAAFPPVSIDVIEAECALREGQLDLAADMASRARGRLPADHPLRSRAGSIEGHSRFLRCLFKEAELAFGDARSCAQDDRDALEALHGLVTTRVFGERGETASAVAELAKIKHHSPTHNLRASNAQILWRRLEGGLREDLDLHLAEGLHASEHVDDPRARSSFAYVAAYTLAQLAEYQRALEWLERMQRDVKNYELEFARPHTFWTAAMIHIGLRRFGEAERFLQSVEDFAANHGSVEHALNARSLRSRLFIQTGQLQDALRLTASEPSTQIYPSWRAELIATRALTLALAGKTAKALQSAKAAVSLSRMAEVRGLAATALGVAAARAGRTTEAFHALRVANDIEIWDPLLCGLRASPEFAECLAAQPHGREILEALYLRSNDTALARKAGIRIRATRAPSELLSPRELEVLGLVASGLRNSEIARALFISQSTTKVHLRHVFEKLGVRNRAEAITRYKMFSTSE